MSIADVFTPPTHTHTLTYTHICTYILSHAHAQHYRHNGVPEGGSRLVETLRCSAALPCGQPHTHHIYTYTHQQMIVKSRFLVGASSHAVM